MDKAKIGSARQQDDNRVAVMTAKGLGDCWLELCAAFEAAELQSADYQPDQMAMYRSMQPEPDSAEGQAWIKACIMSDKTTDTLRQAVATGELPIWRMNEAREVMLAPVILERGNVKYGVFKSSEWPEPEMQGARLWVKNADWISFLQRTIIPAPTSALLPPDKQFVTLSEALTWGAFGVSMNSDVLHNVLLLDSYGTVIPQKALKTATARLLKLANEGKVAMRGKYRESHRIELRTLLTDTIDPIKFADFRQFNYLHDELKHGNGLWEWKEPSGAIQSGNRRGGRPDSYCHVSVSREDLLREFPPKDGNTPRAPGPIVWDAFGSESLPELQRLSERASRDEWWTWPEAIAWIGSRDANNIATLRYWGREWFGRGGGDRDPTIILGAQAFMATQFCKSGREAEADLLNAIQCGQVGTSGRLSKGAVATDLQPSIWRGGTVVWHDGETVLVDARQKLTAWAFDVAIRRKDLVATFPVGPRGTSENAPKVRKRPGPAPDPDWPHAIAKVTQDCIAAGYTRPLKRGGKAAIQAMLLSYMADKDKHFSDDIAAKHAKTVIAALPDN